MGTQPKPLDPKALRAIMLIAIFCQYESQREWFRKNVVSNSHDASRLKSVTEEWMAKNIEDNICEILESSNIKPQELAETCEIAAVVQFAHQVLGDETTHPGPLQNLDKESFKLLINIALELGEDGSELEKHLLTANWNGIQRELVLISGNGITSLLTQIRHQLQPILNKQFNPRTDQDIRQITEKSVSALEAASSAKKYLAQVATIRARLEASTNTI